MPQPKKEPVKPAEIVNLVALFAAIWANAITPFLRTGEGKQAYASAPFTFFGLVAFSDSIPALRLYLTPWCIMVVWKKLFYSRVQHSRYQGYPWLAGLLFKREKKARFFEIPLVFVAGVAIAFISPDLGGFIASTGVALWLLMLSQVISIQAEKDRYVDARIEMMQQAQLSNGQDIW